MVTIYDLLLASILGICGSDASVAYPIPFIHITYVAHLVQNLVKHTDDSLILKSENFKINSLI